MRETKPLQKVTLPMLATAAIDRPPAQEAENCLNCHFPLLQKTKFCPDCGQATAVHRLSFSHLLHEMVHFFTHADKGIFYLVRQLARRPGTVIREYVAGRRKVYFSPLNFFLIAVGMFLFVQTTFKPMRVTNLEGAKNAAMQIPDPVVK